MLVGKGRPNSTGARWRRRRGSALIILALSILVSVSALQYPSQAGATTLPPDYFSYSSVGRTGYAYATSIGGVCQYGGDSTNMVDQQYGVVNCANKETVFENEGTACSGCDHVRLFWGDYYTGAYACITPGWYWNDRSYNNPSLPANHGAATFGYLSTASGYGQSVWFNTASLEWVGGC